MIIIHHKNFSVRGHAFERFGAIFERFHGLYGLWEVLSTRLCVFDASNELNITTGQHWKGPKCAHLCPS